MDPIKMAALWESILSELKNYIPTQLYEAWIKSSIIPYSYENDILTLDTINQFVCGFVQKKYSAILTESTSRVIGRPTQVILISSNPSVPSKPQIPEAETIQLSEPSVQPMIVPDTIPVKHNSTAPDIIYTETIPIENNYSVNDAIVSPDIEEEQSDELNSNYTFNTFIVGNSNRIAHAAALSIAEAPALKYNPFFIYGGSGLGKTHLMHAIGHRIREKFPNLRLRCITSEDFANELISSIQDKNPESFRQQYRNIDVLLVDDIQFLENKEHTQEEFFHTFNKLYKDHKQMVFTSDRPPQDIKKMEERLRSRFQGGMVTSIDPPDLETRTAILRKKAEMEHVNIEKDAVDFIASNVNENIRELEGAFVRVLMQASEEKSSITLELTQRALKEMVQAKEEKKYITIDEIQREVCRFYKIKIDDLFGKKKIKSIALPRQIAMYLCRELTSNTFPHIGNSFGGRDHTTVMHACDKVSKMIEKDENFEMMINQITQNIRGVDK